MGATTGVGDDPPIRRDAVFWTLLVVGTLLPWATGTAVKLWLDHLGRSTYPWSYFLTPTALGVYLLLAARFALPHLGLAVLSRRIRRAPIWGLARGSSRLLVVWCAALAGWIGTVFTFRGVFWSFDVLYFLVPLEGFIVASMASGTVVGVVAARSRERRKGTFPAGIRSG